MGSEKERRIGRFTSGVIVSSGSSADRITEFRAGSVSMESPSFDGGDIASREEVSVTVTGLDASHIVVVTPASLPGACTLLVAACAITDAIETTWANTAGSEGPATSTCQITLQFLAFKTQSQ